MILFKVNLLTQISIKYLLYSLINRHIVGQNLVTNKELEPVVLRVYSFSIVTRKSIICSFITHVIVRTSGIFILRLSIPSANEISKRWTVN